jgi:hypothetical protein
MLPGKTGTPPSKIEYPPLLKIIFWFTKSRRISKGNETKNNQKNRKENEVDIWFYNILIIITYNYFFSFSLIVSKSGLYPLQHPWAAITSDVFPNASIPLSSTIIHFPPLMSIQ